MLSKLICLRHMGATKAADDPHPEITYRIQLDTNVENNAP